MIYTNAGYYFLYFSAFIVGQLFWRKVLNQAGQVGVTFEELLRSPMCTYIE